ncbi:MAG: hypothetical protein M3Z06_11125 [Actinomycetota bacterium]|nr:hypothetical protein [Actinomycetota bacterium]
MAAQPARRWSPADTSAPPRRARRAPADQVERRRRERHRRRLRRDLLEDFGLALLLTLTALILTAGLGVIALLEVPLLGLVIASFGLERRLRVRRTRPADDRHAGVPVSAGPSGSRRRAGSSRR